MYFSLFVGIYLIIVTTKHPPRKTNSPVALTSIAIPNIVRNEGRVQRWGCNWILPPKASSISFTAPKTYLAKNSTGNPVYCYLYLSVTLVRWSII